MKIYDLQKTDETFYYIVIDKYTNDYFLVKNAVCSANVSNFLKNHYEISYTELTKRFYIFFNGDKSKINLLNIYKKYHKIFKKDDLLNV